MKRPLAFLIPLLLAAGTALQAGPFAQLKEEIATARKELVTMVLHRDQRGPEQQKKVKETAEAVSAHLAKLKAPAGKEAEFKELGATWNAFRTTREKELVPAILANQKDRYERIGAGIQKERLDRMYALIDAIEK
ncbi:MAG: hypothetical protein LWW79_05475 [Holophagaceae bacterium]|nr:hypothetical protein [Holophagaceae bacterium]